MEYRDNRKFELKRMIGSFLLSVMSVFGNVGGEHVAWGAMGTAQEITPDADTVLLDRCNGTTAGTAFGPLDFDISLPGLGEACQLGPGIYVQYRFPSWYPSSGPGSDMATQGTVEMWIRAEQLGDLLNFNWNDTTSYPSAGHVLHFLIDPQAGNVFSYGTWNFERCCLPSGMTGTSFIPVGEWVHLAVSWSPTISKIYINGIVEASIDANVYPAIASTVYAYLGYWGGAGGTTGAGVFTGLIDEVHISRVQRSDEEILAHATRESMLDALKCYKARGTAPRTVVSLTDSYESKQTLVLKPAAVCNAVDVDGEGTNSPGAALTCYSIQDVKGQPKFEPREVDVVNSIDAQVVRVTKPALLCLPSTTMD